MKENNKAQIKKYQDDVSLIKDLLLKTDETLYVESWAFYVWGAALIICSIIHLISFQRYNLDLFLALKRIWLPGLIISSFFETIAWRRKSVKDAITMFSRTGSKFFFALIALSVGFTFIIAILFSHNHTNDLAIVIMVMFSTYLFVLAQVSYSFFNYNGLLLIIAAVILHQFNLSSHMQFIYCGIIMGLSFIISGILAHQKERNR